MRCNPLYVLNSAFWALLVAFLPSCERSDDALTAACPSGDLMEYPWLEDLEFRLRMENKAGGFQLIAYQQGGESLILLRECPNCDYPLLTLFSCDGEILCSSNVDPSAMNSCTNRLAGATASLELAYACGPAVAVSSSRFLESSDDFTILQAVITDDCLTLEIAASGCDGTNWSADLVDSGTILESLPLQRNVALKFTNPEECTAVIRQQLSFDLYPIQVSHYNSLLLNIDGWDTPINYPYATLDTFEIFGIWNLIGIAGSDFNIALEPSEIIWEIARNPDHLVVTNSKSLLPQHTFTSGTHDYFLFDDDNGIPSFFVENINYGRIRVQNANVFSLDALDDGGVQHFFRRKPE